MSTSKKSGEAGSKAKLYWAIGIVIAILVAALLIWNSGIFVKNSTAATVGEENYTVSELAYFYQIAANSTINMAQQYKQYGIDMGYDPDLSPAQQMYNEEEQKTYEDYFMETALSQLQRVSILCKQAKEDGYTLSDEGKQAVEDNFSQLRVYSIQAGATEDAYLRMVYGRFMTKSLFKDLLTQSILADEYAAHKAEQFTYDDEKLNTYYNENAASLDSYDYRYAYINLKTEAKTDAEGNPIEPTEEETAAAMEVAKKDANNMVSEVRNGTAFNTAARNYLDETSAASYEDPEYNHATDTLGSALNSTFSAWLMEDGRTTGNVTAIEVPGTGYCVVQFLGRSKAENSYQTMSYRNIKLLAETTAGEDGTAAPTEEQLAAAKKQADELLSQFQSGTPTAEAFGTLAKEKSADEATKANGGLTENANRDTLPAAVKEWLFDTDRKIGDAAVVEATDDTGKVVGYEVLFADGFGEIRWKYQATQKLRTADYDGWYAEIQKSYEAVLTDAAKKIPTL